METLNTSTLTNYSSFLQNVSNDSSDWTENNTTEKDDFLNVVFFVACLLGVPGNLLVIVVYVGNMATSTRVYMFALAVADSAVCVCVIIITTNTMDMITMIVVKFAINISVTFSMFLLVFVSIERLIAVRRPHLFNTKAQRGKTALICIALATAIFAAVATVATLRQYEQFSRVFVLCTLCTCLLTMMTCYVVLAATLLKKTRTRSKYHAGVKNRSIPPETTYMTNSLNGIVTSADENVVRPPEPGPSDVSTDLETVSHEQNGPFTISGAMRSEPVFVANRTLAIQAKTYQNVTLLFIVTVVFISCWLPQWISGIGISVPQEVKRVFILNSVLNPFIYGVVSAMFREDVQLFCSQTRTKLSVCNH